jgi:hypothetical protein
MSDSKASPIVVKLPQDLGADDTKNLFAYVVNSDGKVTETTGFTDSAASLTTSAQTLKGSRLFIGSGFPKDYPPSKVDVFALTQAGAYQVAVSPNRDSEIVIQRLPTNIIILPPLHFCEVQGNVTNTLIVNGVPQSGSVCKAKVHICTVEWYFRWPIWLRPIISPGVLGRLKDSVSALHKSSARSDAQKPLPADVEAQILSATPDTIQVVVSNYSDILYPYFCRWPFFWPWFYRVIEQEVVYTDCNGYFEGWLITVGTPVDENVYIWVEANINGNWVTIYDPPYPCHTSWNYVCGTEINISLANTAIPPCNCNTAVVDGTVWFTAIGAYGIATNIQQDLTSTAAIAAGSITVLKIPNAGCTSLYDPYGNQLAPFGGTLNLCLATGPTLPATHYRWSWTYVQDSVGNLLSGTAAAIGGTVSRPYLFPLADGNWESGAVPLNDTDTDGNTAYLLPEYLPTATSYVTVPPLAEWVSFNFISASIDSNQFLDGYVVQLSLELLNKVNGVFQSAPVPANTFQVSNSTDSSNGYDGSSPAPSTYLSVSEDNTIFTLNVRVDNSRVTAQLNDAWLLDAGGSPIPGGNSGPCGFITFTNPSQDVSLGFIASGAFSYAYFSYSLIKGDTGSIISIPSNNYVFDTSVPFTLNGDSYAFSQAGGSGTFSASPTVTDLLSGCPQAAFAESLAVYSLATDGSGELWQTGAPYAASSSVAFALTPTST